MVKEERIAAFIRLRQNLEQLSLGELTSLVQEASNRNPWFDKSNIEQAINGICRLMDKETLTSWVNKYTQPTDTKNIGLVMAGNIPLVGFHDFLSVIMSGHKAIVKLSSQDEILPKFIFNQLAQIDSRIGEYIEIVDKLSEIDAVIATGSDNSASYFKKYFSSVPNIIRSNRVSIAILDGNESKEDLALLGRDIFSYFGLGCRNVAKIFIPEGYELVKLIESMDTNKGIIDHYKYFNNYEYNKAIYLVNKTEHLDSGFVLLRNTSDLVSPLAVVYYEEYPNDELLRKTISQNTSKIQCIVGIKDISLPLVPFGEAQFPKIDDYADGVDTMDFLTNL